MGCNKVWNQAKRKWETVCSSNKGKIALVAGVIVVILIIIVILPSILSILGKVSDYASPTGVVYEKYDAGAGTIESAKLQFYLRPSDNLRPVTTTDAQGSFLMGWEAYSGDTYIVRASKSGYYDSQFLWTAPKVTSDVDTFPVDSIGLKVYATTLTMVVRDKYADSPSNLDDITDQDGANAPNLEIGQGGTAGNPDRDEIILEVVITNTDLDSVIGTNYYDYVKGRQRNFIMVITVEDSSSTDCDYDLLNIVGWQKRVTDGKIWYVKEINPVEYMDDENGEIISGKDGKLFVEITLDISKCQNLKDGASDTNGIDLSIGIYDMTTVSSFLWDEDMSPPTDVIIYKDPSYLTIELVDA